MRRAALLLTVALAACGTTTRTVTQTVTHHQTQTVTVTQTRSVPGPATRTVYSTATVTTIQNVTHTITANAAAAPAAPAVEGPGSYSHATDAAFCSSHACIENFPNGHGYIVQCADGEWSHSGGIYGVCTDHGGPT